MDAASRCAAIQPTTCDNAADTRTYAANATVGLPVTSNTFTAVQASTLTPNNCGPKSWLVSATYSVPVLVPAVPNIPVNVSACYPT